MKRLLGMFVAFLLALTGQVQGEEAGLLGGYAVVNLTPPLDWKASLGGYGARMSKPAEGVHDRVWAKAFVFIDGEKRFAIVTMDILALPPNVKPLVVRELGEEGWTMENVMMLPSHTHTSLDMTALNDKNILNIPQLGVFQPKLLENTVKLLARVIRHASHHLGTISIGTASTIVEGMNRNRRGDVITDKELTVTRIDEHGRTVAVLVNWTAHPTIMDENDMLFSGGWPGYLQRELEAWIGCGVAMFYNGAEGDQSPSGGVGGSNYEIAEDYARKIAVEVYKLYQSIKPVPNPIFNYNYQTIQLPERLPHPQFSETGGAEYGIDDVAMKVILATMLSERTICGAVRLGDLLIAGVPGEMSCELGLQIKNELRQAGIKHPVIGGLANEWISYILSEKDYQKGGYEAGISFYGPKLGETIVNGVLETAMPLVK